MDWFGEEEKFHSNPSNVQTTENIALSNNECIKPDLNMILRTKMEVCPQLASILDLTLGKFLSYTPLPPVSVISSMHIAIFSLPPELSSSEHLNPPGIKFSVGLFPSSHNRLNMRHRICKAQDGSYLLLLPQFSDPQFQSAIPIILQTIERDRGTFTKARGDMEA